MKEIYEFAVQLAQRAGTNTLKYFRTSISIDTKTDNSPVTIADRSTEEFIRQEIEKHFPDDGILGEEFGEKPGRSGYRWDLDPIDGTKTFIRGVPFYGTLIAREYRGESQIGVAHFPALNETVSAYTGHGCYYNGECCRVSKTASVAEAAFMSTTFNEYLQLLGEAALLRLLRETGFQRTWADCYGYLLVATGRADAVLDTKVHVWDVAPLLPIVVEAGGKVTSLDGETSLQIPNMFASNGILHEALLEILRTPSKS